VPVFATRQPNGQNIKIEYEKPIIHSDAVTMTTEINKRISARIEKNPEQWYWLHNRWNKE
jgi:KDO2-lipid IV(A) lauroyltransferase